MKRCSRAAAAVFALSLALVPVAWAVDEVWITIDRGSAQYALAGLAAAGRPGGLVIVDAARPEALSTAARDTDVVVGRISQRDVDMLPEILHAARRRCGGFVWHATREEAEKAAAQANDQDRRDHATVINYTIDNGPVVQAMMAQVRETSIRKMITGLGAFFTRRHNCPTGLQSAAWIRSRWQNLAATRPDVTVEYFVHVNTPQPSIVLTIPGTTLASEVVVLGGHQDSTAGSNCSTAKAPGEDDDASGIANLTEVIRVAMLLNYHPQRTVKFMAYAAEEVGLVGSAEIADSYHDQSVNVVGVLQLDMTNYKGSSGDIYIYNDYTNPTQNAFVASLVSTYLPGLVQGTSACGYGCSDHASWHSEGYPASFPFESTFSQSNPWIHTSQDTISKSGGTANHALKFSKLAAAYLAEVAKGGFASN